MRVVRKTGLVPVNNLVTGGIHGVSPAQALALLEARQAELVPIPDGIETYEHAEPAPVARTVEEVKAIDIPHNWESFHYLRIIQLAKDIFGYEAPPEGRKAKEFALEMLRNEVQRRAATETPAG